MATIGFGEALTAIHKFDPDEARDEHGRWSPSGVPVGGRSPEEENSLRAYQDTAYGRINRALLGRSEPTDETKAHIKNLDTLMARATLHQPTTLYRGMMDSARTFGDDSLVGKTVTYKNFLSTSSDETVAVDRSGINEEYAPGEKNPAMVLQITTKPGAHALDMNNAGGLPSMTHEHEILLDRGTSLRIDRIDHGERTIYATQV